MAPGLTLHAAVNGEAPRPTPRPQPPALAAHLREQRADPLGQVRKRKKLRIVSQCERQSSHYKHNAGTRAPYTPAVHALTPENGCLPALLSGTVTSVVETD